jgi:hypothetical protein
MTTRLPRYLCLWLALTVCPHLWAAGGKASSPAPVELFPMPLDGYTPVAVDAGIVEVIKHRASEEPFNVFVTVIFALAVLHTFMTARIRHWSHVIEERHAVRLKKRIQETDNDGNDQPDGVSFWGQTFHFMGEIEAVFGIWAFVLFIAIGWNKGLDTAIHYIGEDVNFNEAIFVVIIMTLASTRPVLKLAERCLRFFAQIGKGTPVAWWLSILIIAPLMGSFITEPAAMTIAALLLASQFYALKPSNRLKYGTIGLLFVNISIGGTLTHFAAPPVLMVAGAWGWDMAYMMTHFGLKAALGILLATGTYLLIFKKELFALKAETPTRKRAEEPIPAWVTAVHLLFLAFTVGMAHHPALVVGGFLFFLAFAQATAHHQSKVELRMPMLVGFFLAGLVIHGGLQGWWIEPVLGSLGKVPLFVGATVLTAFNDNALITYLATLVPELTDELKLAVVKGAVAGGGLTVIANAPNPAGQSILQRHFEDGVSPVGLLLGSLIPTIIVGTVFLLL